MAGGKAVSADDDATGFQNEGYDGLFEDPSEDEDDDGPNAYEKDGFIVDDLEEEDEEDNCGEKQKKKKKKKREAERSYLLDEDDYELLQESNILVPRPNLDKKLKRLKKAHGVTKEESSHFSGERQHNGSQKGWQTAEERLKYSLFGDDDGQSFEDMDEEDEQQEKQDVDIAEEDEMADFIVDEDQVYEHGAPMRRKKQPRSMQQSGITSSALQEAREIFGDVEDLLKIRKLEAVDTICEAGGRILEDQFDPSVLSEKYMTRKDDQIRKIDIPERIQIYEESTCLSPLDEISIEVESEWIYNQLVSGAVPFYSKSADATEGSDELKGHIAKYLELIHVQKLDVPFTAMYRKEEILSLLKDPDDPEAYLQADPIQKPKLKRHKVLWTIRDLDQKWLLLLKRKGTLQSYYAKRFKEETRRVYDETKLNLNKQLFASITMSLKAANSESEVDDVDSKFSLHFPPDEVFLNEGMYKRPKRKSHYSICSKAGLWEVANRFGYSSEQFGLLISLEKMRMDELEDAKEEPEEMASNFTSMMFETPQAVLKGARHMVAVEMSCEPSVLKHVRSIFMDNAVVSTRPTPDGNAAINSFHQFSGVKWLRDKPLSRFEDAQWLLIQKAEEEKLLQVTIKLPEAVLDKLLSDSKDYYLSDGVSKSAQSWNEQRKQILQDAFHNILLPSMEKEARSWLTSRSKTWLLEEYGKLLWDKVSVAPYQRKENDISSNEEAAPRVLACCWGPGKPATTFVMLDSSGEIEDVLNAGCLNLRGQSVNDLQRKKNDQQRVQKFMMDHQPHVVVLGAANLSCTRLKDDIYEIIFKLVEDNPRDCQKIDSLNIVYGDESLPHLYENSRISVDQLPSHEGIIRRAVALGRYLQNPLAMAATLCGPGREILSWKLNPLEKFLTPDEKYGMVEQVMIEATNQVGIDINLASSHEWLFSPMQFISGLGPRKAASLQRSLVRAGAIFTRKDLLTSHGLGKKVFINAVGFLRVRRSGLSSSSSQYIDLLDDTRIHPESYSLAQALAKDVYCESMNNEVNDDDDDDLLEMAIEHVRENSHLLTAVDVYEYAEQKNRQNKKATLNDIRLELMDGFQDWRKPHEEPNQDDEFYMIAGEAEETLAEGRIVQATVRRVQEDRAICNLDSGLTGILSKEDYTDDWRDINELTDKLHERDILKCRIKSIQKNRYQVFLTCRESEMRSNRCNNNQIVDPYFHEERSTLQPKQEIAHREKELSKKLFKPRMIVHPQFKNIKADEAFEFLRDKEVGESVVRPSLRGPSCLTLTLKVYDGVFANKDIVEGQKELKDITSLLQIGKTLKIGEDTFEDLDEVKDRYVDPLIAHLKTMINYRKFRKGTKTDIDELLRIEKAKIPTKIVYCLGLSYDHPGTFILTYIRSVNPHHEYIGLYPNGYKFRKRMFGDVDHLVAYFQKHIDDPHSSGPTIQSAAMVPIRSFGSGDDWGGSNNDGDRGGSQSMDGDKTFGLGSRGGRGDSQNGGRGRGRGRGRGHGRGRGRGSYGDGGPDKQDFDHDSQKWGSNNDKSADWGGGASGSAGGWGAGDGSGNTGSWSGVGGGSKGDGNFGGGGSGNTGGWGGAGGGIKSDSNWGGGRSGGAGGLGGGGDRTKSAGAWGGGRGSDRSGSAGGGDDSGNNGGWGGAEGGSKNDGNWGVDGSGVAGGWGGGGQRGSTGDCEIGGGGSKTDGNWGGYRSGDAKGWGKGGSGTTGVGGHGGGGQSGSAGGWGGDSTGHGGSGKTGGWGGGRDNADGGGCGASGGSGGEGGGSGRAGTWVGGGNDSAGGGSANAGAWGGSGGGSGSAGAWGDAGGTSADGSSVRAGGWGGGSNNRSTGGMGEGIGSESTAGGWGGDGSHKSAGGGDRGSGWGSGGDGGSTGGWKGAGHDSAGGDWGGSHGASGGTKGGGAGWGGGRGSSAGGRYGRSRGIGGGRGGSSSRTTGGRGGGTGSGSTSGWGGGGGTTGGWKEGGQDNTGTGWGGSHGASGGSKGRGAGWGGGHGSSGGDGGGGGRSGGAIAWGGSGSDSAGGWVGSGNGGTGAWGDGGSSNAGGGNASTGGSSSSTGVRGGGTGSGCGSGGGSESAGGGGGNAGGWGVSVTKKEGESGGGWGQGSDAGNSGWGSSKKSSEAGNKGGW